MRLVCFFSFIICIHSVYTTIPLVINTWSFQEATKTAWKFLQKGENGIDSLEAGCSVCEIKQCDGTVGYGGSPDEDGETTLDAMIFDGKTMNMGAVGALRRIKNAISVAKYVLKYTSHSMLVGNQATNFAIEMGFQEETLSTNNSRNIWKKWKKDNCQPNYWMDVEPDNKKFCGPYSPVSMNSIYYKNNFDEQLKSDDAFSEKNHDTIGMIVIDSDNNIVAGTSTNGLKHKIPGRVGDSPIPGAGAYADNCCGGAAATGDGDIMMRFLPSFLAVEEMRKGADPTTASEIAITRIINVYPNFFGGVIAVNVNGEYGAACNGMKEFPFSVANNKEIVVKHIKCKIRKAEN